MLDNETEQTVDEVVQSAPASRPTRVARSEIAFPYGSMEDAFSVVQTLSDVGGDLTRDQLSAKMSLPTSTFNVRLGAARMFGLLYVTKEGTLDLTKDGRRIVSNDAAEAATARRDAFFNVALYRRTFEAFKGRNLPDASDLEQHFAKLGVAPKQTDKARSAFERSSSYAGFFHAGRNRLVEPIINVANCSGEQMSSPRANVTDEIGGNYLLEAAHQYLIRGLLDRLPPVDTKWSIDGRVRWLKALAVNLAVIYGPDDDVEIEIKAPSKSPASQTARSVTVPQQTAAATVMPPAKPKGGNSDVPPGGDLDDEIPF